MYQGAAFQNPNHLQKRNTQKQTLSADRLNTLLHYMSLIVLLPVVLS